MCQNLQRSDNSKEYEVSFKIRENQISAQTVLVSTQVKPKKKTIVIVADMFSVSES